MDADEVKKEIVHQRELIKEFREHLRILEIQAAKYGLLAPPHIQTEIEGVKKSIQSCKLHIERVKDNFVYQKSSEHVRISMDLQDAQRRLKQTVIVPFTESEDETKERRMKAQKSTQEIIQKIRFLISKVSDIQNQIAEIENF
jgi:hypothetical protein